MLVDRRHIQHFQSEQRLVRTSQLSFGPRLRVANIVNMPAAAAAAAAARNRSNYKQKKQHAQPPNVIISASYD
jgi:hypothetical protein